MNKINVNPNSKNRCKLCFNEIKDDNFTLFINPNLSLCKQCYKKLIPKFINFKTNGYKALSIYQYDEGVKSLLYQLKGCFDIELASIFLERYCNYYRLMFQGYILVPIPSFQLDDEMREFNHVIEIFSFLKLPIEKAIVKTEHFKQADHNRNERKEIGKYLELVEGVNLTGKKVLVVDDVYTTGSTMKAAIKLVEKLHPKDIKIMVMSKTKDISPFKSEILKY